jgi:ATP-dependent RNA helicase DDX47/RRP3
MPDGENTNTEEPAAEEEQQPSLASADVDQVEEENVTFASLGVCKELCRACESVKWIKPSKIQREVIPVALSGRDIIGLAETGSGKTGAFALPVLQSLLDRPARLFALVLTPTRELAKQIADQFKALGSSFDLKTCVLIGGNVQDRTTEAMSLSKKPHVIVATPGRLLDHLENTKGFHLRTLKYLILDEADRILDLNFEEQIDKILKEIPKERHTYLFSATMTSKVQKLQRASVSDPVRIEVSTKYQTVDKLQQMYLFIPHKFKDTYLVHILNEKAGNSFIVFASTCVSAERITRMLRNLGMSAVSLHGQMNQCKRLAALNKFRGKQRTILVATDVAARGLDIPHVDFVLNYDLPNHSKDYIHRVGRTARAGRSGCSVSFVTQYDVELYQRIEHLIGKKLPLYETVEEEVMFLHERVCEATRLAKIEVADGDKKNKKRKAGRDGGEDDDDDAGEDDGDEVTHVKKRKLQHKSTKGSRTAGMGRKEKFKKGFNKKNRR